MKELEILTVGNTPDIYSWKDSLLPRGAIRCPSLMTPNREEHYTKWKHSYSYACYFRDVCTDADKVTERSIQFQLLKIFVFKNDSTLAPAESGTFPGTLAAISHIIQHTKLCMAFPYFHQRTARSNPGTLHQAGHKHSLLRMHLSVQICSTCCRQAPSLNFHINLIWNVQ